MKELQWDRCLF